MRFIMISASVLLLVVGCGTPGSDPGSLSTAQPAEVNKTPDPAPEDTKPEGVIVTPDNSQSGKVALVNQNAKYVVVSFPIGALPSSGKMMSVYRNGLKVGEIRITGPQKDFDTVADIVSGSSQVGDEIREN